MNGSNRCATRSIFGSLWQTMTVKNQAIKEA
jgi:hypothetical protein